MQGSAPEDLRLSSVVVAELRYGVDRSGRPRLNHSRIDALVEEIECVDFDLKAAAAYGRLRARLERSGKLVGPNDMVGIRGRGTEEIVGTPTASGAHVTGVYNGRIIVPGPDDEG